MIKALSNAENFELLQEGVLSEQQEECIAAGIKSVLNDFKEIRSCKRKTRNLFKKRFHREVNSVNSSNYVFDSDIEYSSEVFLFALYSVLREDISYGYLFNAIADELCGRDKKWHSRLVYFCEDNIGFYVKFNIHEIRDEAKAKEDPNERIQFLEEKLYDFKLLDRSQYSEDELSSMVDPVGDQLSILLEEAKSARRYRPKNKRKKDDVPSMADNLSGFDDSDIGFCERIIEGELNAADYGLRIITEQVGNWENQQPARDNNDSGESIGNESLSHQQGLSSHLTFGSRATAKMRPFIVQYLHEHVGFKPGVDELIYFVALYKKKYISLPKPRDIIAEFPSYKKKKSTISSALSITKGSLMKNVSKEKELVMNDIGDAFDSEFQHYLIELNNSES